MLIKMEFILPFKTQGLEVIFFWNWTDARNKSEIAKWQRDVRQRTEGREEREKWKITRM